jgi:hypothetical protein
VKPRHTSIEETVTTREGTLVREAYYGHPIGVSNVYLVDASGRVRWEAELPDARDAFANQIVVEADAFRCSTWNGVMATVSLATGKLLSTKFTK